MGLLYEDHKNMIDLVTLRISSHENYIYRYGNAPLDIILMGL